MVIEFAFTSVTPSLYLQKCVQQICFLVCNKELTSRNNNYLEDEFPSITTSIPTIFTALVRKQTNMYGQLRTVPRFNTPVNNPYTINEHININLF